MAHACDSSPGEVGYRRAAVNLSGALLARNTLYSLVGQIASLTAGLVAVPILVRGLGIERFGVLALAWVVTGYLSLLDLGLGRATTRFIADALGRGSRELVRSILSTSLAFLAGIGSLIAVGLAAITPFLVTSLLHLSASLQAEAIQVFYISAASVLTMVITSAYRGVLEAYQRFDLIAATKVPSDILTALVPVFAMVFIGPSLPPIAGLLLAKNILLCLAYGFFAYRMLPPGDRTFRRGAFDVRGMLGYGGWIALHNMAVAGLLYLDRFLVGVLLTVSAVSYYSVGQELASRSQLLPSSLMAVLFPAFSFLQASESGLLARRFAQALKYTSLSMAVVAGILIVFAREILTLWLGPDFTRSVSVLQITSAGVFFSALAWLGGTYLQALGSARWVTLVHVAQVPIYVIASWFLIRRSGIDGAALAWSLRLLVSAVLLFLPAYRRAGDVWAIGGKRLVATLILLIFLFGLCSVVKTWMPDATGTLVSVGLVFLGTGGILWRFALDKSEQAAIAAMLKRGLAGQEGGRHAY